MINDSDLDVRAAFLAGAEVVAAAVASPEVGAMWDEPSTLPGQTVGGLASHVARAGVWTVSEYLPTLSATAPLTHASAAAYYGDMVTNLTEAQHEQIRQRGADIASDGQEAVVARLREQIEAIRVALPTMPADAWLTVIFDCVIRVDDYLRTRIVEQTVHIDDLGRSTGGSWAMPPACEAIALELALGIGCMRFGAARMLRGLYRSDCSVFPVL